jgi:hypothetical protein
VGQDLIKAATIQAQITQIQKFNTAANTFMAKYGYLPGDMPNPPAVGLGFVARAGAPGQGDGNGIIQSTQCNGFSPQAGMEYMGESPVFWVDLSSAGLIEGTFNTPSKERPTAPMFM